MRRALATVAMLALAATGAVAATKKPTNGADRIVGNAKANVINALAGNDRVFGRAGNDTLSGRRGEDRLKGEAGDDNVNGGGGDDIVDGGLGNDQLTGGGGQDDLLGGDGDDVIDARDSRSDDIDCGPGNDTVTVDRIEDGVFDCETVNRPEGAP